MNREERVEKHLQRFDDWAKNQTGLSDRSRGNYRSSIKKFYMTSGISPIDPSELDKKKISQISDLLVTSVTSRSMKYGLKKYFDFLTIQASNVEAESNINFLYRKLGKMEFDPEEKDIGNKIMSRERVQVITGKAGEEDWELGLLYRMMYETATRASGMYLLEWRDVERTEWEGDKIGDHQIFISKERSKGETDGLVKISKQTLQDLQELKNLRDEKPGRKENVFFPEMTRMSVYQKMWRLTQGVEESTHWFRHSRLTHLGMYLYEQEGLDYDSIKGKLQRYARHEDSKTTEKFYIDLLKNKIMRKGENMAGYEVNW